MIRGIGLRGAVALNVITMIGIGPLVTIPLVLAQLHGATALAAWIVGAIVALCDGLAWAELGSLYPGSGGTYTFLRETFGRERWGRLLGFLFAWQTLLSGPLLLATGYIGFAHYAGYIWTPLRSNANLQGIVAAGLAVITLVILYRRINTLGALSIGLAAVAIATLCAVIAAAATRFSASQALSVDKHSGLVTQLAAGLGPALIITLYDYAGYGQSCTIGDEVRRPAIVLPRSVVISIVGIALLYLALQLGVLGIVPWQELVPSGPNGVVADAASYVASSVVERVWGTFPAQLFTLAVLGTAFGSVFGNLLGYARIPYAAAVDGVFLRPFAKLHAKGHFPQVALVTMGLLSIPPCFLSLADVINALTAGIVIIQSIAQLVAVAALRARGVRAPYRMWLYPLPALVALGGWSYIFFSAGSAAIAFGILSLAAGVVVYVVRARSRAEWPFKPKAGAVALALLVFGVCYGPAPAAAATWGHARVVEHEGQPVFEVDGTPFFLYGAAFFYERLPRDRWDDSMTRLAALGVNTLDLYVPWNWHEPADGDFDFNGRTNSRRDLDEVLRLARKHGFEIVLRPGPVVRNEWRNGGYPAWLLKRPEYGMPLHDLLEGRYPPTATLQNAHSDDAAAEWMRNATHVAYAQRWLERVLHECAPYANRIVAVALDDDQAAYFDNQTWPAPHLRAYLDWLHGVVASVTGSRELVFINTYQMKVPASSPVWAMGNWYQSDAYQLGEHDVAQLAFSTALLGTRPHQPLFESEFQAGWLEGPGDIRPRPADPRNTSLALAEMIALGMRGIVNFPAQDTLNPGGWEAPFANSFYAWDAALRLDGTSADRYAPTAAAGAFLRQFGTRLAASPVAYDAAIAYLGESFAPARSDNALFAEIGSQTIAAQTVCRAAGLSCALVDPVAISALDLQRYRLLIVPQLQTLGTPPLVVRTQQRLDEFVRRGGRTIAGVPSPVALLAALRSAGLQPVVQGVPDATFAPDASGTLAGFLSVLNDGEQDVSVPSGSVELANHLRLRLPPFIVPAHSGLVAAVGRHPSEHFAGDDGGAPPPLAAPVRTLSGASVPVRDDAVLPAPLPPRPATEPVRAFRADVYRDGESEVVLDNGLVRLVVTPAAGARAFVFEDDVTGRSIFTSVGAMRDDVALEPPLSTTDRIAKYTHEFPAGMFNRDYDAGIAQSGARAVAHFSYDAPDVVPDGARFERTVTLEAGARAFSVDEEVEVHSPGATQEAVVSATLTAQRGVAVSSLAVGSGGDMTSRQLFTPRPLPFAAGTTLVVRDGHALGYYDSVTHELATIAWRDGDVDEARILEQRFSIVVRLKLAPARLTHVRYGYDFVVSPADVPLALAAADDAAQVPTQGTPPTARTPWVVGKWRNGLRDRLKSD